MKKLKKNILVLIASVLIVSCAGFQYLQSKNYVQARIQITTNPRAVSNMQFVNGWTSEYGSAYSAENVGVMVANQLAEQGLHDACVLVELVSRGNANASTYDIEAHLNMWQISVFRSQAPKETAVPQRKAIDFFDLVATGTPNQVVEAIKAGADINTRDPKHGATPVMAASYSNRNPEVISTLLNAGADVNAQDMSGTTPLMYAVGGNANPDVLTTLLKAGADVNAQEKSGQTPLAQAAEFNQNPEVITVLVKAGADLNALDKHGATPLMSAAAENKNPAVILALIDAGADLNARDPKYGATSLMLAAMRNQNPEVVTTLLKAGADGKAKDNRGLTAFDYADSNAKLKGTDAYQQLEEASQ